MEENKVFTVTELSRQVKSVIERNFGEVWVEGEISGFKVSSLGHVYFDLKDSESVVSVVMFRGLAGYLRFRPENGLQVKVRALVTTYARQSKYQLNAREIVPGSYGPLQIAFEKLKVKLAKEGLFDKSGKKKIPRFPKKIAVLTSMHGAAVRDILSIIQRRHRGLSILLVPVRVQGEGAAEEIAAKVSAVNAKFPETDALLVGRGGGSMEDIWAFNEEILARAIAASEIPVISCVGHETDFTIADFVADLRAPTPSAAAEIVVESRKEIERHLFQLKRRLSQSLKITYENLKGRFARLASARVFRDPETILEKCFQRLDEAAEGLVGAVESRIRDYSEKAKFFNGKIVALSPYLPMKRGYSIVRSGGEVVADSARLETGDLLDIEFGRGRALGRVEKTTK